VSRKKVKDDNELKIEVNQEVVLIVVVDLMVLGLVAVKVVDWMPSAEVE
jgi:hypothetical protein